MLDQKTSILSVGKEVDDMCWLNPQEKNASLEAALGAARAQLRELEGAYDLAAAADSLNAAARAAAEEELAAARCCSILC